MNARRAVTFLLAALLAAIGPFADARPVPNVAAQSGEPAVCHWVGAATRPAERLSSSQHLIALRVERSLAGGPADGAEETFVLNSTYGATYFRGFDIRPGLALEARGYQRQGGQCVIDTLNVGTLEPGQEGYLRPADACPTAGPETIAVSERASLALGCAASPVVTEPTAVQRFQGGLMLHLNAIYVLQYGPPELGEARRGGGAWSGVRDTFRAPEPTQLGLTPPNPELAEPQLGFGKAWRERYGGPEGPLGWAAEPEQTQSADWQLFDGGIVAVTQSGEAFILYHQPAQIWEQRAR
jgi:hypothetical protein